MVAAKADRRTIVEKKAAFEAEPTLALALALASDAATGSKYKAAVVYLRARPSELDPANAGEYRKQILMSMIYGIEDGAFTMDDVIAKAKPVMASDETPVDRQAGTGPDAEVHGRQDRRHATSAVPFIEAGLGRQRRLHRRGGPQDTATTSPSTMPCWWRRTPPRPYELYRDSHARRLGRRPRTVEQVRLVVLRERHQPGRGPGDGRSRVSNWPKPTARRPTSWTPPRRSATPWATATRPWPRSSSAIELDPNKQYFKDQLVRFEKAAEEKKKG